MSSTWNTLPHSPSWGYQVSLGFSRKPSLTPSLGEVLLWCAPIGLCTSTHHSTYHTVHTVVETTVYLSDPPLDYKFNEERDHAHLLPYCYVAMPDIQWVLNQWKNVWALDNHLRHYHHHQNSSEHLLSVSIWYWAKENFLKFNCYHQATWAQHKNKNSKLGLSIKIYS